MNLRGLGIGGGGLLNLSFRCGLGDRKVRLLSRCSGGDLLIVRGVGGGLICLVRGRSWHWCGGERLIVLGVGGGLNVLSGGGLLNCLLGIGLILLVLGPSSRGSGVGGDGVYGVCT